MIERQCNGLRILCTSDARGSKERRRYLAMNGEYSLGAAGDVRGRKEAIYASLSDTSSEQSIHTYRCGSGVFE